MNPAGKKSNLTKAIGLKLVLALFFVSSLMVLLISVAVNVQMDRYEAMTTEAARNHLMSSAQALATFVSTEELDRYHTAEDTDSPDYEMLRERLIRFAQDHNVLFAYYWRDHGNGKLQYIIDNDTDPQSQVGPGSFYDIENIALDALSEKVGSTDLGTYTPTWDGLITGYAPVYDKDGNFYCVAGIDISDEFIFIQRRDSRNMTLLQIVVFSVSVIFGALNMLLYSRKNRQIEVAHREVLKANRAKSDFLAVMSHEIRTPLNAVIGISQIELQSKLPAATRNNIMQIHRSGSYLLGIINDILDISKIESGNFEIIPVEYETAPFISDTIHLNRVRIGSKPINFFLEIDGDFPRELIGDDLRVKQILNNLLSNAAKYTQEGTITLSVSKEQRAEIKGQSRETVLIRFTVKDTGIGIRAEDMQKLFSSFTQLDSSVNRNTEGTGLGLPIAQKLAQMMGGAITVESEYGAGSVFTAQIIQGTVNSEQRIVNSGQRIVNSEQRIVNSEQGIDEDVIGEDVAESLRNFRYASEWEDKFARSTIPPAKLLVVDDIPVNLLVARGLLAPYGLHVDTAACGTEAIEQVKANNYDLIFIDHMMPEMDGIETAAAIKTGAPIIALTANAMRGMKEYYLEHGFNDYLSKPINAKELDAILVKWIKTNDRKQLTNNREQLTVNREQLTVNREQLTVNSEQLAVDSEQLTVNREQPSDNDTDNCSLLIDNRSLLIDDRSLPIDSLLPDNYYMEVESMRLDMLNHYRVSFEIGKEFDSAYFERFTALVQSLDVKDSPALQEQSAALQAALALQTALIEAGRKEDAHAIREKLPALYETLKGTA